MNLKEWVKCRVWVIFLLLVVVPVVAEPLRVVCTLSTYGEIAQQLGADSVSVSSIASPRFNPHFIEPKPSDVLRLKRAELFIHSGLDLEAWREPLLIAAGNAEVRPGGARELDLSRGIHLLNVPSGQISRAQGDIHLFGNPHYFTSPENAIVIGRTIAAKLIELIPDQKMAIEGRLADLVVKLEEFNSQTKQKFSSFRGQPLVAYHDEWIYLADFLGLRIERFVEPKPGVPPTPQHLLELQNYMKEQRVKAIIQTSYFPSSDSEHLAEETGASVIRLCPLVGSLPECKDLLSTFEFNIRQILDALNR